MCDACIVANRIQGIEDVRGGVKDALGGIVLDDASRAASIIDRLREGDLIADVRLTAGGARAVGMWPTADPAQAFIVAL